VGWAVGRIKAFAVRPLALDQRPRLVPGPHLAAERPAGLVLEVEVAERLPGAVADDEAGVVS
jgi:hypothetical protein